MNFLEDFSCHPSFRFSLFCRQGDVEVTTSWTDYAGTRHAVMKLT